MVHCLSRVQGPVVWERIYTHRHYPSMRRRPTYMQTQAERVTSSGIDYVPGERHASFPPLTAEGLSVGSRTDGHYDQLFGE